MEDGARQGWHSHRRCPGRVAREAAPWRFRGVARVRERGRGWEGEPREKSWGPETTSSEKQRLWGGRSTEKRLGRGGPRPWRRERPRAGTAAGPGSPPVTLQASAWICREPGEVCDPLWASVSWFSLQLQVLESETMVLQEAWAAPALGGRGEGAGAGGINRALDRRLDTAQTWRDVGGAHMCLVL